MNGLILKLKTSLEAQQFFAVFATQLYQRFCSLVVQKEVVSIAKLKEKMWVQYSLYRAAIFLEMWQTCCNKLGAMLEPLHLPPHYVSENQQALSKDDENIPRYACGYVAMKLKKKFTKATATNEKALKFIECLNKMEITIDGPESAFYDYTKEWVTKVDRGGLFKVSDNAYLLFASTEHAINRKMNECLQLTSRKTLACDGNGEEK